MKMKLPLALEAAESLIFVPWFVSVTLAPATTAPVGSRIVPLTPPVALCCARPTEPASRIHSVYIATGRKGRMTFLLRVWSDVSLGGSASVWLSGTRLVPLRRVIGSGREEPERTYNRFVL